MKKESIVYSDLSKKELQEIKEIYIKQKVNSMSEKELKEFVLEIISHQINNTIGKEEEMEAWDEMSDFFGEKFEITILEIKQKYNDENNSNNDSNPQKERIELLEKNSTGQEQKDMWED